MGSQPLWDMFLIPASSLQLVWSPTNLNFNCSIGGLRAPSADCWFSLPHLISNWLNFLCTELYNSSAPTFFLWASQIALIQLVHGQGYILIFLDRMHLLFTQVHFLFWLLGRGQYVTLLDMTRCLIFYFSFEFKYFSLEQKKKELDVIYIFNRWSLLEEWDE